MPTRWAKPAELDRDREARHARRQLQRQEQYLACLRRAQRLSADLRVSPDAQLQQLISSGEGRETKHSILGLKIVPWNESYDGVWES